MEKYKSVRLTEEQKTNILKFFGKFEKIREKAYLKYNLSKWGSVFSIFLGIILLLFPIPLTLLFHSGNNLLPHFDIDLSVELTSISFGITLFILGISYSLYPKTIKMEFKSKIKKRCYKYLLKNFYNLEWYNCMPVEKSYIPESKVGVDNKILKKSALFEDYERKIIDDEFKGSYKNIDFGISELCICGSTSRILVEVFKGVIVLFNSNKKVLNRTIITTKGDNKTAKYSILQVISTGIFISLPLGFLVFTMVTNFRNNHNLEALIAGFCVFFIIFLIVVTIFSNSKKEALNKVTLEDPKFNKKFNVYSSDQVEARYLVTPAFMERLNKLRTAFSTNKIKCSFFDDKFMVAISTNKDLFEIGNINKPLTNLSAVRVFFKELNSIYEMIDYFKLNEKTGL